MRSKDPPDSSTLLALYNIAGRVDDRCLQGPVRIWYRASVRHVRARRAFLCIEKSFSISQLFNIMYHFVTDSSRNILSYLKAHLFRSLLDCHVWRPYKVFKRVYAISQINTTLASLSSCTVMIGSSIDLSVKSGSLYFK